MKIHKITLKDYNQFKDLKIDLTYPKGHPKAGQPLDKVCFIGQSGTGKTSLLRLIKYFLEEKHENSKGIDTARFRDNSVEMKFGFDDIVYNLVVTKEGIVLVNTQSLSFDGWFNAKMLHYNSNAPILINFPTEQAVLSSGKRDANNEILSGLKKSDDDFNFCLDFETEDRSIAWKGVLTEIRTHIATEMEWRSKISEAALKFNTDYTEIRKIGDEFEAWQKQNPSPLEKYAAVIDQIIRPFGLKVKTLIDKEALLDLGTITLQTLAGTTIDRNFWSTGTKQIIDTLFPLMVVNPKNAIVLIDEPERSLYPNMQQKIIDLYTAQGTDCQFFFATHSPIIASSFDPWEIVELKFDDTYMNVIQETNYSGERHVDNYTVYPKYLRWDGILMKLFDLTDAGNADHRMEKLMEAASLKRKLNKLKEKGENKGEKFDAMLEEFIKIKSQVGWDEKD